MDTEWNSAHMGYAVFEDLQSKTYINTPSNLPVKIHRDTCRYYLKRSVNALTVKWSKPFDDLKEAEDFARLIGKPWRRAQCCP